MSGVATLKARGVKRPIDEMAIDAPASCSPTRFALRPGAASFKRSRFSPPPGLRVAANSSGSQPRVALPMSACTGAGASASSVMVASNSGASSSSPGGGAAAGSSNGTKIERLSADDIAALARHVPKRLKKVVARYASGVVAPDEKLFTAADLREIVTSVCAEREARLGEEFQKLLNEKLAEQFRTFTRFNEDFISRKMRDRDCSYLS